MKVKTITTIKRKTKIKTIRTVKKMQIQTKLTQIPTLSKIG